MTRKLLLFAVLTIVFGVFANAGDGSPYQQTQNVVYGEVDGVGLLMDVFTPPANNDAANGIGVVCVVSGAWNSDRGMVDAYIKSGFFDILCAHGYTVFGVRPGSLALFTAPQMVSHIELAIRYVKEHASDYGIDPTRLILTGVSAGGHLACLVATDPKPGDKSAENPVDRFDTEVAAVGVFCPATDFLDWNGEKYGLGLVEWRLVFPDGAGNRSETEKDEAAKAVSPIYRVGPGLPPFLFIHGDADSVVPIQQSQKMVSALQEQGVSAELIEKPGGDHMWPSVREEIEKLAGWFDKTVPAAQSKDARGTVRP